MIYRNVRNGELRDFKCEISGIYWERVEPAPVSESAPAKKPTTKKAVKKQNGDKLRDN